MKSGMFFATQVRKGIRFKNYKHNSMYKDNT